MSPILIALPILFIIIFMIYTLVKNALLGSQLSPKDEFKGTVDLIIPITKNSDFYEDNWFSQLSSSPLMGNQFKIHLLFLETSFDDSQKWLELKEKVPFIDVHAFSQKPLGKEEVPWMLSQMRNQTNGDVVIIGDAEIVPTVQAFHSVGQLVENSKKAYFIFPQNTKQSFLQDSLTSLNPNLALLSLFGFKRIRRGFSHPLFSLTKGWMAMPRETFLEMEWNKINFPSWKESLMKTWDLNNKLFQLTFAEKQLMLHSPQNLLQLFIKMKNSWSDVWSHADRMGLGLFILILYIWSYPGLNLFSSPFFAFIGALLLFIYRVISKIIFQESWSAVCLHPFASLAWLFSLFWWLGELIKKQLFIKRL